jgi:hypothetical protein
MGKLITLKKSEINKKVEAGHRLVSDWTKKHLKELQETSKLPIVISLTNGNYKVATYDVIFDGTCWIADSKYFLDKRSAIYYCALLHMSRFKSATEIVSLDNKVRDLDADKAMFRYRLDAAHETGDQWSIDLFSSRYTEVKGRLTLAKRELEHAFTKAVPTIRYK